MPGMELSEGWGRKGVLGGKWPFPGGEGALGESIRSGATRLGAGGLRGGGREPWEGAGGCRDIPARPLHRETSKEREGKKKGKKKALLSLSLGEGVLEPTGVILGSLGRHGWCCGDGV